MEFVCYADWASMPAGADTLFDESAKDSIFFSRPWFENLVNTALDDGHSMLLACVVDQRKALAILPLMSQDRQHLYGLTNLYSSLFSLLLVQHDDQAYRQSIVECLARGLDNMGLDSMAITSLRLDPVAEGDQDVQMLIEAMETMGYQCHRRFRFHNWIYRLEGQSFDDYMYNRPSRVRNTVSRKQRKLEREHGYTIRLYTDTQVQQALADYDKVYRASWKANELYQPFIEGLAHSLSASGWLRLAVLYIGDEPAAAQFWFVCHGKASIFKLVYDQAWKHYSPGSILISYLMQHVIDVDRVEEIDFLTGNDSYKQDWMSERRQRWTISLFRPDRPKELPEGRLKRLITPLKNMLLTDK